MEKVYFKVQAEFICNLVRTQYWLEKKPYKKAIKSLTDSFDGLTEDIAKDILQGKKLLVGLYPDEEIALKDDNAHQQYLDNRKYIDINERIPEEKKLTDYEEFLIAFKNELPSYACRFENHENDNSTIDYRLPTLFNNLQANYLKLVGICKEPEYAKENRVGFVLEDQKDFSQFWYHGMDINSYKLILEEFENYSKR